MSGGVIKEKKNTSQHFEILFKTNMYIWYLQVLNVQILTQQMDAPQSSTLGFFSRAGPIMTPTKGYVVFCSFPAGKFV